MNISTIFTAKTRQMPQYTCMADMLHTEAEHMDSCFFTDTAPDIVHVFGRFDKATADAVARCRQLHIPTVLTVCDALGAFADGRQTIGHTQFMAQRRRLLTAASAVHATGQEEGVAIAATAPKANVTVIANPVVTSCILPHDMAKAFAQLYLHTIETHERLIGEQIGRTIAAAMKKAGTPGEQAKTLSEVCARIMYARYLNNRGLLSLQRVGTLAEMFNTVVYDEAALATLLPRMGMRGFTASLLALLYERGLVSEGFMPIDMAHKPLQLKTFTAHT